jgi:hypothetical protein
MTVRPQRLCGALIAVITSLALPAGASAVTLHGTVVHHAKRAHSFVIAGPTGVMHAVHASHSPRLGRAVTVRATRLANGTYAANHVVAGRTHRRVHVRGVVTYRGRQGYVVSARGVSLLVHRKSGARVSADATPGIGDQVEVTGEIDDQGDLQESAVSTDGTVPATTAVQLEGVILAIEPATDTLTISADDDQESGATLTVFRLGHEIELLATPTGAGAFTAVQSAGDGDAHEADDQGENQGGDSHGAGGEDHGATGQPAPSTGDDSPGEDSSGDDETDAGTGASATPVGAPEGSGSHEGSGSGD